MTDKSDASTDAPAAGERIVIRDKRKISPTSGTGTKPGEPEESKESNGSEATASEPEAASDKVKPAEAGVTKPAEQKAPGQPEAATAAEAGPVVDSAELGELRSALDERTADLQRITAEYANYRKRVERDRAMAGELAVGMVLTELLAVLDDIDRARDHGDLTGPFAAVSDKLTTVTSKFGLTAFGAKGDAFDPNRHEAVAHQTSSEVTEPTCIEVMRRGYLLGERLLRPALVAVADPESE